MRFSHKRALALALLLALASALALAEAQPPEEAEAPWTFPLSEAVMADPEGFLILVNADNKLTKADVPTDLVNVKTRKSGSSDIKLRKPVSAALQAMFDAADAEGVKLYAHSGYRSYRTQEVQHYNRVKSMGYDDKYVQQAGASDHQTGMGVDVISRAWIGHKLNGEFFNTDEGQWLAAHCMEYGFIIRYPDGQQDVTGIAYEPWHLRYIGPEAAQYVMENALTLEAFWAQWLAYPNEPTEDPVQDAWSEPEVVAEGG
jgi:D-alanyl-D-alanine carboxypeptidase